MEFEIFEAYGKRFAEARLKRPLHRPWLPGDQMIKWGDRPIEVEVIRATIKLKTNREGLRVYSMTPEGMIQGTIPSTYKDGELTFTVGDTWRSI